MPTSINVNACHTVVRRHASGWLEARTRSSTNEWISHLSTTCCTSQAQDRKDVLSGRCVCCLLVCKQIGLICRLCFFVGKQGALLPVSAKEKYRIALARTFIFPPSTRPRDGNVRRRIRSAGGLYHSMSSVAMPSFIPDRDTHKARTRQTAGRNVSRSPYP